MPPRTSDTISMNPVMQAIKSRMTGMAVPGQLNQVTSPTAPSPMGGPSTPTQPPAPSVSPTGTPNVGAALASKQQAVDQAKQAQFDDQTRGIAKALVAKLMQLM